MEFVLMFLASYGLCFGLMNGKAWFLTDRLKALPLWKIERKEDDETVTSTFFQRMLVCPYCTGFHTGWIAWLLIRLPQHVVAFKVESVLEAITTAFASAAVCYLLDTVAQWWEDTSAAATASVEDE